MVVVKQWIETGYVWKDRARWVQLRSRFSGDGYLSSSIQRWHNRFHDFRPDSLPSSSSSSSIFYRKRVSEDIDAEKESVLTRMHQAVAVPVIGNVCHVFMHGLNHVQGMDMAITKLNRDEWVHIFLEGSRSRDGGKTMGSPKRGIGRKKLGFEMKALRAVRALNSAMVSPKPKQKTHSNSIIWKRFYVAQPQEEDGHQTSTSISSSEDDEGFDSSHYEMDGNHVNNVFEAGRSKTWDEKYRERVKSKVFGEETKSSTILEKEVEKRKRAAVLARALLEASVVDQESKGEDKEVVREEDQMSLSVGIIGAPNAGKSALTNYMVGTKVAAVSRKTNTTTHEVLGVMTKGHTQICFFDTPGLMLKKSGFPYNDMKVRVESAWGSVSLYDVLIVIFDVNRHLTRSDSRVVRLIERMGSQVNTTQKRILCMNKVDLVEKKKDLLKVVEEFKDLPGFERHFMISGLKGWGVMDLTQYLMQQAVKRPWDEDPFTMSEEVMKNISLEVVREKLLEYIHQEIPYNIEHRLMDWKELRDGSLRIEQHFITPKMSQRKILVGKKGSKIGRIGVEANEELRSIFKRNVHLILMVRVK